MPTLPHDKRAMAPMKVIVEIDGRAAIPVRAIPLLTSWTVMSPDVVAKELGHHEEDLSAFGVVYAYLLVTPTKYSKVEPRDWREWVEHPIEGCDSRISATEIDRNVGRLQWREESFRLLPAGVFVWQDEFESAYMYEYGPESPRARNNPDLRQEDRVLNYEPIGGPCADWRRLVLEGFEELIRDRFPTSVDGQRDSHTSDLRQSDCVSKLVDGVDTAPTAAGAAPVHPSESNYWYLRTPKRYTGYTEPLYRALKAAHDAGEPCPHAAQVIESWRASAPAGIMKVLDASIEYMTSGEGVAKTADRRAIQKAIDRMTGRKSGR